LSTVTKSKILSIFIIFLFFLLWVKFFLHLSFNRWKILVQDNNMFIDTWFHFIGNEFFPSFLFDKILISWILHLWLFVLILLQDNVIWIDILIFIHLRLLRLFLRVRIITFLVINISAMVIIFLLNLVSTIQVIELFFYCRRFCFQFRKLLSDNGRLLYHLLL